MGNLGDSSIDGTMPAVIAQRAEETLVYCSANELVGKIVVVEHVVKGIRLAFEPKMTPGLDILTYLVDDRFTGVNNDSTVLRVINGAYTWSESASKEVVPGGKTPVLLGWVAIVRFFEIVENLPG